MAHSATGGGIHAKDLSKADVSVNIYAFLKAQATGKPVELFCAIGDTEIDGMVIHENDIMGIGDHKMLAVGTEVNATTVEMIDKMIEESDAELISIYYGADITKEAAEALADLVSEAHGDCDVELQYGGQPVYYYIVSAE